MLHAVLCSRFDPTLKAAIAAQFVTYAYPPASCLYEKGGPCDEMHVVLSGACVWVVVWRV